MTDGQLLEAFVERGDSAAFEALVQAHGSMVFGVCLRVLGNHHDAEEAFQATYLVLARKAPAISAEPSVANWLYGVAHRTALKARGIRSRRRIRERQVTSIPEPEARRAAPAGELMAVLDQELSRQIGRASCRERGWE